MVFTHEIKDFIKNTLILTIFFTLVLHLSWRYVAPILGLSTNANSNDTRFVQTNVTYLGNIATAMSLNIGQKETQIRNTPVNLGNDIVSIAEVLTHPEDGQRRLIGGNMIAITTYSNILNTNVGNLLDGATDRAATLDEYISLLRSYGNQTNDRLVILDEQVADLRAILTKSAADINTTKVTMQTAYNELDYSNVDTAIATYTQAKQEDDRARVYLVFLENFAKLYTTLQSKNRTLLDALTANREALIKRSIVTIPSSGSDILKELKLIQTEAEARANTTID